MKNYKGIDYIVTQNRRLGFPLAYIRIPEEHPWYKIDDYDKMDLDVHGGCTFMAMIDKSDAEKQLSEQGFTAGKWIGWDYGHAGDWDYPPMTLGQKNTEWNKEMGNKFWQFEEVEKEIFEAIDQLLKAKSTE